MVIVKANCKTCEHWRGNKVYTKCQFAPNMSWLLRFIILFVGCEHYMLDKEIARAQRKKG
jgi:hypothetical protein